MVVVTVEVDGGEQKDAGGGSDEGVAEDDIPVSEVVQETPVITLQSPLISLGYKVINLREI